MYGGQGSDEHQSYANTLHTYMHAHMQTTQSTIPCTVPTYYGESHSFVVVDHVSQQLGSSCH